MSEDGAERLRLWREFHPQRRDETWEAMLARVRAAERDACARECDYRAAEYATPLRADDADERWTNGVVAGALHDAARAIREGAAADAVDHEHAATLRASPIAAEAERRATVACEACGGRGMVLCGAEVEDGCDACDACDATGRVDATAEVERLRERDRLQRKQSTHHALRDIEDRAALHSLLAAAARGELPRCDECPHAATLHAATTAGEYYRCDAHAGADEWETLPHAAALRAVLGGGA